MQILKQFIYKLVLLCCCSTLLSQRIEIHQIDVGTGDATLINILDNMGVKQHSILIDAGETNMDDDVINYLKAHARMNGLYVQLDYIISSHYHSDHIGGFVGRKVNYFATTAKRRRCETTYTGVLGDTTIKYFAVLDKGTSIPSSQSTLYGKYNALAGARRIAVGETTIGNLGAINSIVPTIVFPPINPTVAQRLSLGGFIDLGQDENGVAIRLRLVVANAKVYAPGQAQNTYNVADSLGIRRAYSGRNTRPNPNNWGLGWVLEYGAFRYYTAGDIGGYNSSYGTCTSCNSSYFDIETPLATYLQIIYPNPANSVGHICAQKISHHGSCCSTNQTFWQTLRPSLGIISSGPEVGFGHPTQEVITRMENIAWHADSLRYDNLNRYLMTELYFYNRNIDLTKGSTSGSRLVVATDQLVNPIHIDTSYLMANGSYLYFINNTVPIVSGNAIIKVNSLNGGIPITQQSRYWVEYLKYENTPLIQYFNCHGQ